MSGYAKIREIKYVTYCVWKDPDKTQLHQSPGTIEVSS